MKGVQNQKIVSVVNEKKVIGTKVARSTIASRWVVNKIQIIPNILICPICFNFVFQPVECSNCSHLFCAEDYITSKRIRNKCPICNNEPWNIKPKIHLIYQSLIKQIVFQCKICGSTSEKYKLEEFKGHLLGKHKKEIKDYKLRLYKYWLKNQNNKKIILNFTQNLQINYSLFECRGEVEMYDEHYGLFDINLISGICQFTTKDGKLIHTKLQKQQIKQSESYINFDKIYHVWVFDNNSTGQNVQQFYLHTNQQVIEKGYQKYLKNSSNSSVNIDVNGQVGKYKIVFSTLLQVNNSTQNTMVVRRKEIVFCSSIK